MSGKIYASIIVIAAIVGGGLMYYMQVYAYYDEVRIGDETQAGIVDVRLIGLVSEQSEEILFEDFEAVNSVASPLGFRACFTTPHSQAMLSETYVTYEGAEPLTGPGWFKCYDAMEVGLALETGEAMAFLSQENINDGVDRVIAFFPDGRGFIWHQLNKKYKE